MREYYKQLYVNKINDLEEIDRFLEKFKLPKLTQEGNLNRPMTSKEIELIIFKTSHKEKPKPK